MTSIPKYYWDANCWLGLINAEDAKIEALQHVYEDARAHQCEIWTSTLSFVEVNRLKSESGTPKPLDDSPGLDIINHVFEQDFVKMIPLDVAIGKSARSLLREHKGLSKRTDAIHLASALFWNLDEMHTYDNADLLHLNLRVRRRDGTKLKICKPALPSPGDLFIPS